MLFTAAKEPIDRVNMTEELAPRDGTKEATGGPLLPRNATVIATTALHPAGSTTGDPTPRIRSVFFHHLHAIAFAQPDG